MDSPYPCRFIFPLGHKFPTILIHFSSQVKGWQNGRSSERESWMNDMFSGANSKNGDDIRWWDMDQCKE